jgi:protein-tyrosine-phosphatase
MPKKILFICQANVGRSQMAEGFYNHKTQSSDATSAGTDDVGAKYNFSPAPNIINIMLEKGIDVSSQKIKHLSKQLVENVDTVVILCDKSLCPQWLLDSSKVIVSTVEDPFEQDLDTMRKIRDEIEEIVTGLIS